MTPATPGPSIRATIQQTVVLAAAIVALALLYGVGGIVGWSTGGAQGAALFAPLSAAPLLSLVSGLVQAAIAWTLAGRRIGKAG